jgi:hypothetical protein
VSLHIVKLAVGIRDVDHLAEVQIRRLADIRARLGGEAKLWHKTRHGPRRGRELLDGGSMYWVVKGRIAVRQRLLGFETDADEEGRRLCHILLDPVLVPTVSRRHRAFQGWRYLKAADAPADQPEGRREHDFPPALAEELRELGLL